MNNVLISTNFKLPGQTGFYKGKVRDVYTIDDKYLVMVVTDRISAFDVVLPEGIPYKGEVLNRIADKFLDATKDIVPNWKIKLCDPNVMIGKLCEPFKVEMVIRGYLSGHAWREYKQGKRLICGVAMPEGMKENDRFPEPIITPTTKALVGHDEDISDKEIIDQGLVSEQDYALLKKYTMQLFIKGSEIADRMGLILVDTKYEFGKADDKIYLIDEVHTPDSSRYFYKNGYQDRQQKNEQQKQLSKEFVREWLMENGFQGKEGQTVPDMNIGVVNSISERYIELYESIAGEKFVKSDLKDIIKRVENNILSFLKNN